MDPHYDLIIIGAGPAGLTAAIYAKRAGLNILMVEGSAPGGKLVKTYEIDNWPGESRISGVDLALKMFNHTNDLGVDSDYFNVVKIDVDGTDRIVVAEDGRRFVAKAVILATGTIENKMGIPNEERLTGRGVSFCAVCDGAFYKEKEVVVIGGGNSALEEAVYLTQFARKVTIVIRRDVFRGDQKAQDHLLANPKIEVIRLHVPTEVLGDDHVTGIKLRHVQTGEEQILPVDGIFPYIGATASTGSVAHLHVSDSSGYLVVNEKMETAVPGIYGAGDVNAKILRQVVTAVNDGAIAAQSAFHYIKSLD
jgi:thioredoxin reductase (NADPH)